MNFKDVEKAREEYRKKYQKTFIISTIIAMAVTSIPGVIMQIHLAKGIVGLLSIFFFILFSLVLGIIISTIVSRNQAKAYQKAYKAYFVEKILKETFTDLEYSHDKGVSREYIRATEMINTGDSYSSNDLTIAHYKNVKFLQSDAHIQVRETDSDGDTHYVTIFRGRFMVFEFPKKFNFKLELIGNRFSAARIPGKDSKTGRKMTKKSTESGEFNGAFRIYGQDDFESFYILDPAFMVKIMNIAGRYNNRLLLGFYDNKLLVALNDGKDSFEPPKFTKPIDEKAEFAKIQADIQVVMDFVDQLSLDHKLFQ